MKRVRVLASMLGMVLCLGACQSEEVIEEVAVVADQEVEEVTAEVEEVIEEEIEKVEEASVVETIEDVDQSAMAILPDTKLSEEEQSLVGLWEAEDGCILAIRERGHNANEDEFFELDVILYTTRIGEALKEEYGDGMWMKITREDGSSFTMNEDSYVIADAHLCPTGDDPSSVDWATYEVTYDIADDCLKLTYDSPQLFDLGTFYRTDKDITEADWAYYYNLHPDRDVNYK
ncbi:MAG: hypothetical protein R3Y24_09995 [Eubacteriales bacterium]